eukprot:GHVU01117228.1.p1 GENE.GHVU01117228.1~~GHVU01117228.1.p1  ORF type:complete len:151 (-),score=23.77 GHVU01117228.1:483-935(-)
MINTTNFSHRDKLLYDGLMNVDFPLNENEDLDDDWIAGTDCHSSNCSESSTSGLNDEHDDQQVSIVFENDEVEETDGESHNEYEEEDKGDAKKENPRRQNVVVEEAASSSQAPVPVAGKNIEIPNCAVVSHDVDYVTNCRNEDSKESWCG